MNSVKIAEYFHGLLSERLSNYGFDLECPAIKAPHHSSGSSLWYKNGEVRLLIGFGVMDHSTEIRFGHIWEDESGRVSPSNTYQAFINYYGLTGETNFGCLPEPKQNQRIFSKIEELLIDTLPAIMKRITDEDIKQIESQAPFGVWHIYSKREVFDSSIAKPSKLNKLPFS